MILLIFPTLLTGLLAAPMQQGLTVNEDGSYQFYYETGKEGGSHTRSEIRHPDGLVEGKFSYEDANGDIREVSYRADDYGYVANGDVSVEGAPKGQFPAVEEVPPTTDLPPAEEQKTTKPPTEEPKSKEATASKQVEEPKPTDEAKGLNLEDSPVNDPPEGFPEGFFLQHFQGLRRLPEPTKEESAKESTALPTLVTDEIEPPKKDEKVPKEDNSIQTAEEPINNVAVEPTEKVGGDMELFMNLRPFQSFPAPQSMAPPLFHQPVYIFSYQHPDSYGYHYYY